LWFIFGILGYNNIFIHMQISIQDKVSLQYFFGKYFKVQMFCKKEDCGTLVTCKS
jgi:hypothetical protein